MLNVTLDWNDIQFAKINTKGVTVFTNLKKIEIPMKDFLADPNRKLVSPQVEEFVQTIITGLQKLQRDIENEDVY